VRASLSAIATPGPGPGPGRADARGHGFASGSGGFCSAMIAEGEDIRNIESQECQRRLGTPSRFPIMIRTRAHWHFKFPVLAAAAARAAGESGPGGSYVGTGGLDVSVGAKGGVDSVQRKVHGDVRSSKGHVSLRGPWRS
jgi:hypothetical protein